MDNNKHLENKSFARKMQLLCIIITSSTLIIFFLVGCLWFLRPDVSESEKRTLTPFPEFTWEDFFSGKWTSDLNLWYSDTYPLREGMIGANDAINNLYGFKSDTYSQSGGTADVLDSDKEIDKDKLNTDNIVIDDGEENDKDAGNNGEMIGGFYCVGDTAYELYYFNEKNSIAYVNLINRTAEKLKGKVNVYDMIVPLAYEFSLGDNVIKSEGASDCSDAIDYMYKGLSDNVSQVDICKNMRRHKDEYMYFRTDHHWTALGAYYAYEAFCQAKGITATPIENYEKLEFEGFLGTLYDKTKNDKLYKNPDTVFAYVPMGTNSIEVLERNGNKSTYSVVNKATDSWYPKANSKYNCFIAGDNPLSTIHNEKITDGSTIIVVKESFGNAFIPFLVDSYEYVYVVDYRYFDGDLCEFAKEKDADDILFINNVIATSTGARLNELKDIIN